MRQNSRARGAKGSLQQTGCSKNPLNRVEMRPLAHRLPALSRLPACRCYRSPRVPRILTVPWELTQYALGKRVMVIPSARNSWASSSKGTSGRPRRRPKKVEIGDDPRPTLVMRYPVRVRHNLGDSS